jgi:hypothetical protein
MRFLLAWFSMISVAQAHPGHGTPELHAHGLSPELVLLALLVALWAILRSRN